MNRVCVITGGGGLIGSEAVRYFSDQFDRIAIIDNNSRAKFFGQEASVEPILNELLKNDKHKLIPIDISNRSLIEESFKAISDIAKIELIIHCAAQPSHDWASSDVHTDFEVNALGTLNLLEAYRQYCPEAVFIFMSTNKVYGDVPNSIRLKELETRYEPDNFHIDAHPGITEHMRIDQCTHSIFGVSKASADLMTQEYGKYFGLKTGVFRGGCLTGPAHKGAQLHGFLSYLVKCAATNTHYDIFGNGKYVRDNIHAHDVCTAFDEFYKNPRPWSVYNLGGGRGNDISILEAIVKINELRKENGLEEWTNYTINEDKIRKGDHIWYVTNLAKFKSDYPNWPGITIKIGEIIREIYNGYIGK